MPSGAQKAVVERRHEAAPTECARAVELLLKANPKNKPQRKGSGALDDTGAQENRGKLHPR